MNTQLAPRPPVLLHGELKVWLETRLGLLGAVFYDGVTAATAALVFRGLEFLATTFWPNGSVLMTVVLFAGHWGITILYVSLASLDVFGHIIHKIHDIRRVWNAFRRT